MSGKYALILAGGKGTRFWPKSRVKFPKQFLSIESDRSFLQITYERVARLIPACNIYIVTTEAQAPIIKRQLPAITDAQIVIEPVGRNTCPAIALGVSYISKNDPNAVILVAPSDQLIKDEDRFVGIAAGALAYADEHNSFVVFGIKPNCPHTGYGYIKANLGNDEFHKVDSFVEKPAKEVAKQYLEAGNYFWNSGMFVFSTQVFFSDLQRNLPQLSEQIGAIRAALDTPQEKQRISEIYPQAESISIDYGIMERAQDIVISSLDVGWNDVGSWSSLYDVLELDNKGNNFQNKQSVAVSSEHVISLSSKVVATVGINDVILVDTDDVILLCHKDYAQNVKEVLDSLRASGREDLL